MIAFVAATGLHVMAGPSDPVNISRSVIAGGIALNPAQRMLSNPVVIRDPVRNGLHVWLTTVAGGGRFFWYDEAVGQYQAGQGGYWEETYPSGLEPVCATLWKGSVVAGTRNGRIIRFSDTAKDDLGTAIHTRCPLTVVSLAPERADVHLSGGTLTLGDASNAVTVNLWGGATVEDV